MRRLARSLYFWVLCAVVAGTLVGTLAPARGIALQPLSLQGQTGLNVAVGLQELELRPGR